MLCIHVDGRLSQCVIGFRGIPPISQPRWTGKREFLLVCQCYSEYSERHSPCHAVPALVTWLQHYAQIDFMDVHLSSSDCRAISTVLQHHPLVDKVYLYNCNVSETGIVELLPGLAACHQLTVLFLNLECSISAHISDLTALVTGHVAHLVVVVGHWHINCTL